MYEWNIHLFGLLPHFRLYEAQDILLPKSKATINIYLLSPLHLFTCFHSGTAAPLACPEGSWSNSSGLQAEDECKACPGGFYCQAAGITKPSGVCSGGYVALRKRVLVLIAKLLSWWMHSSVLVMLKALHINMLRQIVWVTRGCEGWGQLNVTIDHHYSFRFMEESKVLT